MDTDNENYNVYMEERVEQLSISIAEVQQRMDFFESVVLRLLVGLKEAGIITESEVDTVDTDSEVSVVDVD